MLLNRNNLLSDCASAINKHQAQWRM